jgi:hypothetical protein
MQMYEMDLKETSIRGAKVVQNPNTSAYTSGKRFKNSFFILFCEKKP